MKSIAISLCVLVRASCMSYSGVFQNLNFENVITNKLEVVPTAFISGLLGPTHDILPGWNAPTHCLVWGDTQKLVLPLGHNGVAGVNLIIPGSISGLATLSSPILEFYANLSPYSRIVGDYGFVLESFNREISAELGVLLDCSCISQTGNVEALSKSIIYGGFSTPVSIYIESNKQQSLPLFIRSDEKTGGQDLQYWGLDISQYSGTEIVLTFAGLGQPNQRSFHFLDDIRFTSESIESLSTKISAQVINGEVWLDWGGRLSDEQNRRLQFSENPEGPWEPLFDAANPFSASEILIPNKVFRVIPDFPKE